MELQHAGARYVTTYVENRTEGYAGIELIHDRDGTHVIVARVIYWDAYGQYFVETCGSDVPLTVLEAAIHDVKARVRVR
jgi:hypothetical protein